MKQPTIAVDVDGTLLINGAANEILIDYLTEKKAEGYDIFLWSARGKSHAQDVATRFNLTNLFSAIISKPDIMIDDRGWSWTRYVNVLSSNSMLVNSTKA